MRGGAKIFCLPFLLAHFFNLTPPPLGNISSPQPSTVTKSKMPPNTKMYTRAELCIIQDKNYMYIEKGLKGNENYFELGEVRVIFNFDACYVEVTGMPQCNSPLTSSFLFVK